MAYWASRLLASRTSAPRHSPEGCMDPGGCWQGPLEPNSAPKKAACTWSKCFRRRQASSPTVPDKSIFNFSTGIRSDQLSASHLYDLVIWRSGDVAIRTGPHDQQGRDGNDHR